MSFLAALGPTFTTLPASEFPAYHGEVLELDSTASVNDAFRLLIRYNLLSAPVWDAKTSSYLGFFDIMDAVSHATVLEHLMDGTSTETTDHRVSQVFEAQAHVLSVPWCPVTPTTPMSDVMIILATKARRVPVIGASGKVVKIISQSLVSAQIHEALSKMAPEDQPKLFSLTAKQSGALKPVLCIPEGTKAKEAFSALVANNHSAIGVTDEDGLLLTVITAKDIRLLPVVDVVFSPKGSSSKLRRDDTNEEEEGLSSSELLDLPAIEFVSKARLVSEKRGKARPAVVTVHLDTPINVMIARLAKTQMHRLFLVDEEKKPVGVFGVGDVVKLIVFGA